MDDSMIDLAKYGDKLLIGIVSAMAPVILGLIGYWKLKRQGIDKSNYFLVEDNIKLRADLFSEVEVLRAEVRESQTRERALQQQNALQAAEIATLKTRQDAQLQDYVDLKESHKEKVREFRRKINELNAQLALARRPKQ